MYGGLPYAGAPFAGALTSEADIPDDGNIYTAVEVAFTTTPLDPSPAFVDIGGDCRWWDTVRGRSGELERFQPGRATMVLSNRDRQYDSHNVDGPWYGYLKPNRRVRIRETVNGVTYTQYDGYVDRWQLDYPDVGKDATATVTATDLFKILARTDLPTSVYRKEVEADAPEFWWKLDEQLEVAIGQDVALNSGTVGTAGNGTYVGAVYPGSDRIVVNDPGTSLEQANSNVTPGVPVSGVDYPASQLNFFEKFNNPDPFTIELWCRPQEDQSFGLLLFNQATTPGSSQFYLYWFSGVGNTGRFSVTAGAESPNTPVSSAPPGLIYHVVAVFTPNGVNQDVSIYVNGVLAAGPTTFTGTLNTGTITTAAIGRSTSTTGFNWTGRLAQVAVYFQSLSSTRIATHYAAGSSPWQGDTGDVRLGRLADIVGIPAAMRSFDVGEVSLQSAELEGQTALDHALKVGETEFPQIWVTRDGALRFMNKTTLLGRLPDVTFGDEPGEVGYRDLAYDEGDGAIRNDVAVSRLQGVAKTSSDAASILDYGRLDFVREGLLHDSEVYSQAYADLVRIEYAEPRRRISNLELGAPVVGEEAGGWPALLGVELQQAVTVKHQPLGGGDRFEQVCAIEGIRHTSRPGEERTASLTLSPEFTS